MASSRRPGRWIAALLLWGALASLGPVGAAEAGRYRGRRLVDVLRELRESGLELIFSSAVVGNDLRVQNEPSASEPRAVLEEILLPLRLRAEDGPAGSILVLPLEATVPALRGRVLSLAGGRPIAGASIRVLGTGERATSGADGAFEIAGLGAGVHTLIVEADGFETSSLSGIRHAPGVPAELTVELQARPAFVTEVVVTPGRHSIVREEQGARRTVTGEEALLTPTIGGDISRVVELLPGVAAADHSAAFNVRGANARDFSMILDGLELYDPFHLQSFQSPFSLVDSNVVDRIDFLGGGFTAEFGDRNGGFVDISTLLAAEPGQGEVELGTLNSRLAYRARSTQGSGSWLVSARGWYPDEIGEATQLGGGEDLRSRFGDLYVKSTFDVASRHRLSAHALGAYDRLTFQESGQSINESVDARTRNGYLWLTAASEWSSRLASSTVVSVGRIERHRQGVSSAAGKTTVDDDRLVEFAGLRHDAVWRISDTHLLKAGLDLRRLGADYRYATASDADPTASTALRLDPSGTSLALYLAHRARLAPAIATELGLRWDRQGHTGDAQLSPRFNAVWRPRARTELRLAVGRFGQSQRIHELAVEDGETTFGPAEISEQAELSLRHTMARGPRIRLDVYHRTISDVRPRYENLFEPIELFPETAADRVRIAPEAARLRGVELLVQGAPERSLYWWTSYAWSSAEDVVDGVEVPRSWDQPHTGKFLVGYRRDGRWSVSLGGTVHTGWPRTPVEPEATTLPDGTIEIEPVPGGRNSDRFPVYARVDLRARRSFAARQGRIWLTLDVTNLTDRENPCCLDDVFFETRPDGTIDVRYRYAAWLGLTPSFSLLWEF